MTMIVSHLSASLDLFLFNHLTTIFVVQDDGSDYNFMVKSAGYFEKQLPAWVVLPDSS